MIKIGCAALSNKIYAGTTRMTKQGEVWTKKEDVTGEAVGAVAEHMLSEAKNRNGTYEVNFAGFGKMMFVLENKKEE